jgi:predicted RNA-binding Zn-ribbon protein involved in translation (DUF1610 family)
MVFLLIWVLFGVGCAIAAANKKRSAAGWFFIGMLLGPFGLLFILLLSPLAAPPSRSYPAPSPPVLPTGEVSLDQETKKCPACAETIKLEALKCRFCGEALDLQEVTRQVADRRAALAEDLEKRTAGKVKCPRCGQWDVYRAAIEDGGQGHWCPNCKISLEKLASQNLKQFYPD